MINTDSVRAVDGSRVPFSDQFIKPLYESYCFARIPATIEALLTDSSREAGLPANVLSDLPVHYDKVILFFVDAFGWRFFTKSSDKYPFLKRFLDQGVVSKLTSQFPSTTAAHTTTIHTGQHVGKSDVFEWLYYEPQLDRIITP